MTKEYCIYSNEFYDKSLLNKEHIIPRKIGGQLDFSILVNKKINSDLGSKVDAPFVESSFVKLHNKDFNYTGHSKKLTPTFKDCVIEDNKEVVDVALLNNGIIFQKKWKQNSPSWNKTIDEYRAKSFSVDFSINMDDYTRFFAKTLLASSYYIYGQDFVKNGFHDDLRFIMNCQNLDEVIKNSHLRTRILSSYENPEPFMNIVTSDIKAFQNYHVVWSSIYKNAIVVGVSLWGNKFLSANCIISDKPDLFTTKNSGIVILKELSKDSDRRLIKTTQEHVIKEFAKKFFPDMELPV